jgi:hypothetical protein
MDSTVSLIKTQHMRFSIAPPVARDTGTLDAPSPIRDILPGNTRQENTRLGGWQGDVYLAVFQASGQGLHEQRRGPWGESNTKQKTPGEKHGH